LFLAASFMRRKSAEIQWMVTGAALLAGILCVGSIWLDLSRPWVEGRTGPGSGTVSMLAWMAGVAIAMVVLLIAVGTAAWEMGAAAWKLSRRRQKGDGAGDSK
jgi:hypothetical protein